MSVKQADQWTHYHPLTHGNRLTNASHPLNQPHRRINETTQRRLAEILGGAPPAKRIESHALRANTNPELDAGIMKSCRLSQNRG